MLEKSRRAIWIAILLHFVSPAHASVEDADRAFDAEQYEAGLAELRRLASAGDPRAEARLGWMMMTGFGTLPRDPVTGRRMMEHAASTGNREAAIMLAGMMTVIDPRQEAYEKSGPVLRKYAEQGDAWAQAYLGQRYLHGAGVPRDPVRALHWIQSAADQGNAFGAYLLGWMYDAGNGVPQDSARAVALYREAAKKNLSAAEYALGVAYETGRGVETDYLLAMTWYRRAARHSLSPLNDGDWPPVRQRPRRCQGRRARCAMAAEGCRRG
ncbi:hypothetical protein OJJOAM_003897 [Cupriavidus sp. H18C1]|uniref:tetratricopeptide repeat protein n=1 Tax=Cupriavidus sp. H18C1 TaxID=3241601 RepID=UPI003BB86AC3